MTSLSDFFHADAETNVHPLLVLWYFISSRYGSIYFIVGIQGPYCALAQMLSAQVTGLFCLNAYMCSMLLHLSNFGLDLSLSSVADFSNTGIKHLKAGVERMYPTIELVKGEEEKVMLNYRVY